MDAIDPNSQKKRLALFTSAAMALPGMVPESMAGTHGEPGLGLSYYHYHEHGQRINVSMPALWTRFLPQERTSVEMLALTDVVSGASPWFASNSTKKTIHTASGASIIDKRRALEMHVTHHFDQFNLGIGGKISDEDDYRSQAIHGNTQLEFNKQNTILNLGIGHSWDSISSTDDPLLHEKRRTWDALLGMTQTLTQTTIMQSNVTFSHGKGYFNDPYKITFQLDETIPSFRMIPDTRPREREQWAWLTRINAHFPEPNGTLHLEYRYFWDDWSIRAHTMDIAWDQFLGEKWLVRPNLRYYTQSQAQFFVDTLPHASTDGPFSTDDRLAAFGSWSPGLKITRKFAMGYSLALRGESYQQKSSWSLKDGSAHFTPLNVTTFFLTLHKQF